MAGRFAGAPQGYLDFDQRQADRRKQEVNSQHLQAIMGQMMWKQRQEQQAASLKNQAMEDAGGAFGPMFGGGMAAPPGAPAGRMFDNSGSGMPLPPPPGMAQGPQPPAPGQASVPSGPPGGQMGPPPMAGPAPARESAPNDAQALARMIQMDRAGQQGSVSGPAPGGRMVPPYQPLPSPPAGAGSPGELPGAPGEIPPPPQEAPRETMPSTPNRGPQDEKLVPTLANAVQALTAQGLTGARLMRALEQIAPRLDAMAQQQIRALNVQLSSERARIAQQESARRTDQGDRRLDQGNQRIAAEQPVRDARTANLIARTAATQGAGGDGEGNLTPEAIDLKARQLLDDPSKALVNLGRGIQGARDIRAITNRAAEMAGAEGSGRGLGQRAAEFRSNSNSLNRLTSSYDAVTAFEQTAVRNGHILKDLATKVDATGIPAIERWIRAGRKTIAGDADVSAFQAQMQVYRTEAARILTNPNLTGQLTDSARKEVEHFLSGSDSAEQIARVVDLLERDFTNRKVTLEQQMDAIRDRMARGVGAGAPRPGGAAPAPGGTAPRPTAPGAPSAGAVPTATNAKGEKLEYRDGQWQPAQTALPPLLPGLR